MSPSSCRPAPHLRQAAAWVTQGAVFTSDSAFPTPLDRGAAGQPVAMCLVCAKLRDGRQHLALRGLRERSVCMQTRRSMQLHAHCTLIPCQGRLSCPRGKRGRHIGIARNQIM